MNSILLIITQSAGILLLLGTVILLFFRRVYLDSSTKEPTKFKLPVFGEISTQSPVLALIVVSAFMVVYPITRMEPDTVALTGHMETGGKHVSAIVVAIPDYEIDQDASGDFSVKIPLLATQATYRVKFIVDKQVIDDQEASLKNGRIELNSVKYAPEIPTGNEEQIPVKKEISDDELRQLHISN